MGSCAGDLTEPHGAPQELGRDGQELGLASIQMPAPVPGSSTAFYLPTKLMGTVKEMVAWAPARRCVTL